MKRLQFIPVCLLWGWLISLGVFGLCGPLQGASREADWKKVDEAVQKGLPKTAIEALEPIIAGALRDQAYGEAAKAMVRKIVLEGTIQGNKPEEKIIRLETEIAKAPKEIVPLLDTVLANWYWHYFQNNRWRFLRRTATAEAPGKDFTTWDLPRLFREIDRQFTKALAQDALLKRTPISVFDALLAKGSAPDPYRPTLYDFIVQEALKFYTSGEQAAAKPQDAFELFADQRVYGIIPVFGAAEEFTAGKIERRANESATEKALFLYRDLLQFHRNDRDVSALVDADLARLAWAYNTAFGEDKSARYKAALQAFTQRWADHEISALAFHHWAAVLESEGNLVEALRLAERGRSVFRDSYGGRLCHNLIVGIETPSSRIATERVWNAPFPSIAVHYRNLTNVWFRAVAYDWNAFLDRRRTRPEYLSDRERKELLSRPSTLAWSAPLPSTPDYKERVQEVPAPVTLKPGFYFLIASHDVDFTDANNVVSFTDVWVSDLALIVRPYDQRLEGFVLQAGAGEPIAGAEVMSWHLDPQGNRVPDGPALRTDTNGMFSFAAAAQRPSLLRVSAELGGVRHELGSMQEYWSQPVPKPEPSSQTLFFTDRALYRPGQTVQYKGICIRIDQTKDDYQLMAGEKLTIVFADANGKEIARTERECNEYGSFSGNFTAPRDRVMGRMQLQVLRGPPGATGISVEEYKRPKFQVALEPPKVAAKLNETVILPGRAESYTGAAVDGAMVKYRVVREVRWPIWWWWSPRRNNVSQGSQEIAHGSTSTGVDGAFTIEFRAKPDPAAAEAEEASFHYTVYADVTDRTGETRSSERSVQVGFIALQVNLSANEWQTEDKALVLRVTTTTLDGAPQSAGGTVRIHRLIEPVSVNRPSLAASYGRYGDGADQGAKPDLSDPNQWTLGGVATEQNFQTDAEGKGQLEFSLRAGPYRAVLETKDRFGRKVSAQLPLQVLKPEAAQFSAKIPHFLGAPDWTLQPGQELRALWGTGYEVGRALIEIEHRNRIVQRYWTQPDHTQQQIPFAIDESFRGGFTLHVTQVRENRGYLTTRHVDVPWKNEELELKWEHFTSKLEPGQKETWTVLITKPSTNGIAQKPALEPAVAEMVAALYDGSLDQYLPHRWINRFQFFRYDYSGRGADFANVSKQFQNIHGQWRTRYLGVDWRYREFPADLVTNFRGFEFASTRLARRGVVAEAALDAAAPPMAAAAVMNGAEAEGGRQESLATARLAEKAKEPADRQRAEEKGPNLNEVTARRNLNETAFFFPQLLSDQQGVVKLQFTMPEALTQWRFLGFAHDRNLRSGFFEDQTVTSRELMVQPNPPRFLREGDRLEFTVKVSNQSTNRQQGKVRLTFKDARTEQSADRLLGNTSAELAFDIPAKESRSFAWPVQVPDGAPFLSYQAVASSGRMSDGEEGFVPVLSRRIYVTESLPLPIRGQAGGPVTKKFEFAKLRNAGKSSTLVHQGLTVQMVSNPAWYAVLALPYLMEYPHECTEQTFNRLYANALARFIANSAPKIRRVFDQWKGTAALDSPLEKNQELKSVMVEETPWLRQANDESQARRNVGILFEAGRLESETERTLQKLAELQLADGSWPWFPGGRGNEYITLYITTGFGRLRHLGADLSIDPALRALNRLDGWMYERYLEIKKLPQPQAYVPSATDALYLYGRSFFLKDRAIAAGHQPAVEFFLARSREHWLKVANRQSQAHLAIALRRFSSSSGGGDPTPAAIMKSLKERSVTNEELGMFWRETELSWWWYRAPIETQALMIEAFDEVMGDQQAVEECRVWLLKQKQTQDWKTTKATADAVYSLLLRGRDLLSDQTLVEVELGGVKVTPASSQRGAGDVAAVEPGTGFYEKRFAAAEIKPKLGEITVRKTTEGVAWGSVHWQYFEDMSKVTPYTGTPLTLNKKLYVRKNTKQGPVLEAVTGSAQVGDELVVRLELKVDRDMEYVHLKDQRGSGTEPVNVLSQYKYQDGLAYYESTRDTASHFFIDYLPKGVYVFEYATRVQHRGQYQSGVAEIQCMYAPEFNSHSDSVILQVGAKR